MEFFLVVVTLLFLFIASGGPKRGRPRKRDTRPAGSGSSQGAQNPPPPAAPKVLVKQTSPIRLSGRAWIIDGDSLVIDRTEVRLFGIDAPELKHPFGQKAKWALVGLCKGCVIDAEHVETDHYDRFVARCRLADGRDLSAEMVKMGLAIDWPKYSGGTYTSLEIPGIRRKLWLADARQRGRMDVWRKFERESRARMNQRTRSQTP